MKDGHNGQFEEKATDDQPRNHVVVVAEIKSIHIFTLVIKLTILIYPQSSASRRKFINYEFILQLGEFLYTSSEYAKNH